jgi:NADPH:quinone reductase-like Zn-dependent oxidoreductase
MNSVIVGVRSLATYMPSSSLVSVNLEGIPLTISRITTTKPSFDPSDTRYRSKVLVKVRAFSCNYRDRALILSITMMPKGASYRCFGSEFVGEVLAVGDDVISFKEGDRVMANNHYPHSSVDGIHPGIPTNFASKRYQVLHESKLIKVPSEMPNKVAAAFSLTAQTTYSMIRKLNLKEGDKVLITSAKSNTSLSIISALSKYGVNVYATSRSLRFERELKSLGVKELIQVDPNAETFSENEKLKDVISNIGLFNAIIDPFSDLHLGKAVEMLEFDGKYITCGLFDQSSAITGKQFSYRGKSLNEILTTLIGRNISLIGNCLGQTQDLQNAIEDHRIGAFNTFIDSVFYDDQIGAFFNQTFNEEMRFGKVVYMYED